jgi:hypothetical protein
MKKMPEINWSEICRQGIEKYLDKEVEKSEELFKTLETLMAKIAKLEFEVQFIKKTIIHEPLPPEKPQEGVGEKHDG